MQNNDIPASFIMLMRSRTTFGTSPEIFQVFPGQDARVLAQSIAEGYGATVERLEPFDIKGYLEALKASAALLAEGASADIWYDAHAYRDQAKEGLIESVQSAMCAIGEVLPSLLDAMAGLEANLSDHSQGCACSTAFQCANAMHKVRAALAGLPLRS